MVLTEREELELLELEEEEARAISPPAKASEQQPAQPAQEQGLGRTIVDQSLQGATFGFADEISDRIGAGIASLLTEEDFSSLLEEARKLSKERLKQQFKQNPGTSIASNIVGGLITGGAAVSTKAGTAVANSLRSGNLAARAAKSAVVGSTTGAVFGAGTAEEGKRLEGAREGAVVGGAFGAAAPVAIAAAGGIKQAAIPKISKALKPLANRAKELGIPLRIDQISPTKARKTVQKISQDLPFSGVDDFEETQRRAFTKAVSRTIGQDTDVLDANAIESFINTANKQFSSALKGKSVKVSAKDIDSIRKIGGSVDKSLGTNLANIVKRNVNDLVDDLSGGVSGDKLASIRSELVKRLPKVEGGAKGFVGDLVDKLDDIASKNLTKTEQNTLKQARREWRNFKTIEPLLEKSTDGLINPTQLKTRVAASKFIKSSRKRVGEDELVDLANIGKTFLPKLGGSDTFSKSALAGAGTATAAGIIEPISTGATLAANRGFQAANTSQRLIDAALSAKSSVPKLTKSPIAGIIAAQSVAKKK